MADDQSAINEGYPLMNYRYMATVGDDNISFSEISGLTMEYESTEHKEATDNGIKTYQLLGQPKSPSITLKKGLFKSESKLYKWFSEIHTSTFTKKDIVISLLDNENNAIMTWNVLNAFPTKFDGPSLNASENNVAFQSLELKADEIQVKNT